MTTTDLPPALRDLATTTTDRNVLAIAAAFDSRRAIDAAAGGKLPNDEGGDPVSAHVPFDRAAALAKANAMVATITNIFPPDFREVPADDESSISRDVRKISEAILAMFRKNVALRTKLEADKELSEAGRVAKFAPAAEQAKLLANYFISDYGAQAGIMLRTIVPRDYAALAAEAWPAEAGASHRLQRELDAVHRMDPISLHAQLVAGDADALRLVALMPALERKALQAKLPKFESGGTLDDFARQGLQHTSAAPKAKVLARRVECLRASCKIATQVAAKIAVGDWTESALSPEAGGHFRSLRKSWDDAA